MRQIARYTGAVQLQMAWEATHMKKEAVSMSPTETMTTASVGYHSTGTGLEIAFAAIPSDLPPAAVVAAAALPTTSSLRWRRD